jgi:hypothetical protein
MGVRRVYGFPEVIVHRFVDGFHGIHDDDGQVSR